MLVLNGTTKDKKAGSVTNTGHVLGLEASGRPAASTSNLFTVSHIVSHGDANRLKYLYHNIQNFQVKGRTSNSGLVFDYSIASLDRSRKYFSGLLE